MPPAPNRVLWLFALSLAANCNGFFSVKGAAPLGKLIAWGHNNYGQSSVPTALTNVIAAAGGGWHSLAVKADGSVFAFGSNEKNQCNVPAGLSGVIAVAAGTYHSVALKSNGTVVAWGYNYANAATPPANLSGITSIAAGSYHTLALRSNGTVTAWGDNSSGQTTIPAGLNGVMAIAAGGAHNLVLKSNKTVVAWGGNGFGESAVPAGLSGVVAIAAGFDHSLAVKEDGTVVVWGSNTHGERNTPGGLFGVIAVAGGFGGSLALKSNGDVVGWGYNVFGQVSIPSNLRGALKLIAGERHALAIVRMPPAIQTQPLDRLVMLGGRVEFHATVIGEGPFKYQWYRDGAALVGATGASLTVTSAQITNAGAYQLLVSNPFYSISSVPASLSVVSSIGNQSAPLGSNITFSANVAGPESLTYQWKFNGTNLPGATASKFKITAAKSSNTGNYQVEIADPGRATVSIGFTLTIFATPLISRQPVDQQIQIGKSMFLSVAATGIPPPAFQWFKNGAALNDSGHIVGSRSNLLAINSANWSDVGAYWVTVANAYGAATSGIAILETNLDRLAPTLTVTSPTANQVAGDSAFTVRGSSKDNRKLAGVSFRLNQSIWQSAQTTNNWSNWFASVTLSPGTNTVQAFATDASFNNSTTQTVKMFRAVPGNLKITMKGQGTVTPSYSGKIVNVGATYPLKATPAPGFRFAGWTGDIATNLATWNFQMRSNLSLTANFSDTATPTLTISSPSANQHLSTAPIIATGSSKDNVGVTGVYYKLNTNSWAKASTANAWVNWSATIVPVGGANTLQVCAVDAGDNIAFSRVAFFYDLKATAVVRIDGSGTILSNYNGKLLDVGKSYTMTAVPGAGSEFNGWSGTVSTLDSKLRFVMEPGFNVTASFAPIFNTPLDVSFSVPSNVVENAIFKVIVNVTNKSSTMVAGAHIWAQSIDVEDGSTGNAYPTSVLNPPITRIPPGKGVSFTQSFRAAGTGSLRLIAAVTAQDGALESSDFSSPTIIISPPKVGSSALSNPHGEALLQTNGATIRIRLRDEETGGKLSAFALGIVMDPRREGQAVVAAVDTLGRYPPQFFWLQGPHGDGELARNQSIAQDMATAPPIELPVDQACGANGNIFRHVLTPIQTRALKPLAPSIEPPSPTIGADRSQPVDLLFEAYKSALGSTKSWAAKTFLQSKLITCREALGEHATGLIQAPFDGIFIEPARSSLRNAFPAIAGPMVMIGGANEIADTINKFHDMYLCRNSDPDTTLLFQSALVPPSFLPSWAQPLGSFYWSSRIDSGDSQGEPIVPILFNATDETGQPISGGSIEMFSQLYLGQGVRAIIGDGSANLPLHIGDVADWCARSPGRFTQSGTVTATSTGAVVKIMMPAAPIVSGVLTSDLGQPTGFQPKGKSFYLKAHFYDANGSEVSCNDTTYEIFNPVGAAVATVDRQSGLVTMLGGCGAARVVAYCQGLESLPKLISSDCIGTEPARPSSTFAIDPTAMTFTATEGGGNPPAQTVYLVVLKNNTLNYHYHWSKNWVTYNSSGNSASIGVKISGLGPGTYTATVSFTDDDGPSQHVMNVTLVIKPKPLAQISGRWNGNLNTSGPFDYGETWNMTWNITQRGTSLTGTFSRTCTYSDLGNRGRIESGSFFSGSISGNSFTLYESGGHTYTGALSVDGLSLTGNGGSHLYFGPFNLRKQ